MKSQSVKKNVLIKQKKITIQTFEKKTTTRRETVYKTFDAYGALMSLNNYNDLNLMMAIFIM